MNELSKPENNLEHEKEIKVERMLLDEHTLDQMVEVEVACFSKEMAEDKEELRKILENQKGIHLKLEDGDNMLGYITSLPHNEEFDFLKQYDSELRNDEDAVYLHSIDIIPEGRNLKNFNALFGAFRNEAMRSGYSKITMYARTENRFSDILQKRYGANFFRRIKDWRDLGEDMDYLEIDLSEKEK